MATPDQTEVHPVVVCDACGADLAAVAALAHDERQVFDIPAIRIEVTAHQVQIKTCPGCGAENRGVFPVGVSGPVQYGVQNLGDLLADHAFYPARGPPRSLRT